MAWIAIDAGTSVIKAVAFADDGHESAVERLNTEVLRPRIGFSEQNMIDTWQAVIGTVRAAVARISEPVRGIVITAQGDGCWLVDPKGNPTGNAVLWNDGRANEIVHDWHERGIIEQAFRQSGSVTYAGLPNAIFHWLRENEPERLRDAKYALTCNGWIFSRLTGEFFADLSDGSNPFCDIQAEKYSCELISLYGADEFAHLLPKIRKGKEVSARLCSSAADELGIAVGTPVVMAPYDIVATAIGAGAASPGQASVILGTTICTEMILSSLSLDGSPSGTTIAIGNGLYLRAMPTLAGCESLEWTAGVLDTQGISGLSQLVSSAEPDSYGAYFLPYLSPAGERAPFLDPCARGSFHGLTLAHTRGQIARSVYEGLSFVIRECLENTSPQKPAEIRVCGGGSQSDFWCQMISDVTGVDVIRPSGAEMGARGAYIFALAVTGAIPSLQTGIDQLISSGATFRPSPRLRDFYEQRFSVFRRLRDLSIPQWQVQAGRA